MNTLRAEVKQMHRDAEDSLVAKRERIYDLINALPASADVSGHVANLKRINTALLSLGFTEN